MSNLAAQPDRAQHKHALSLYLITIIAMAFSGQMIANSVGWQIYDLTKSAFYLGLVGLVQFIPMAAMTLFSGYIADHFNRKVVVLLSGIGFCVCYGYLMVSSYTKALHPSSLLMIAFIIGAVNSLNSPALQSLLPNIVQRSELTKATAQKTACFQAATIIGPALGGLLYAMGAYVVYLVSAAVVLVGCVAILGVWVAPRVRDSQPVNLHSLLGGAQYVRKHPVILGAISLDLFAVLFGGATALLPIFSSTILHIGPIGLGFLRAAPALGAFFVSFYLARRPFTHRVGITMFSAVMVFGISTICFAISRNFWFSFAVLIILGAADVISVVVRSTLVQIQTPNEMLGRVNSINQLFIGTSNQLGEFESGLTAAWFGAIPAALIGGIGTISIVLIWMKLFPRLRKMDQYEDSGEGDWIQEE
ncbi:MAG TPA: MFS transporter [Ruminococcaceae bacterium]|nr:MFS transporter [Oscillospiraceae bacterium]